MRLEYDVVRFTVIPDQGTQVWAQIPVVSTRRMQILAGSSKMVLVTHVKQGHHLRGIVLSTGI